MTREELKALGVAEDKLDGVMALNGKAIEDLKSKVETLTNDNKTLQDSNDTLTTRNSELEKVDVEGYESKYQALQDEYDAFKQTSATELESVKEKGLITKLIHSSGTTDTELLGLLVEKDISTLERTEETKIEEVVAGLIDGYKESKESLFATTPTATGAGHKKESVPKTKTLYEDIKDKINL